MQSFIYAAIFSFVSFKYLNHALAVTVWSRGIKSRPRHQNTLICVQKARRRRGAVACHCHGGVQPSEGRTSPYEPVNMAWQGLGLNQCAKFNDRNICLTINDACITPSTEITMCQLPDVMIAVDCRTCCVWFYCYAHFYVRSGVLYDQRMQLAALISVTRVDQTKQALRMKVGGTMDGLTSKADHMVR